jgi:hypothetical protein
VVQHDVTQLTGVVADQHRQRPQPKDAAEASRGSTGPAGRASPHSPSPRTPTRTIQPPFLAALPGQEPAPDRTDTERQAMHEERERLLAPFRALPRTPQNHHDQGALRYLGRRMIPP